MFYDARQSDIRDAMILGEIQHEMLRVIAVLCRERAERACRRTAAVYAALLRRKDARHARMFTCAARDARLTFARSLFLFIYVYARLRV